MTIHRARIGSDIVAEFTLPEKISKKIAIVATGMPSAPSKTGLLTFLASVGYIAIHPRYRGTWESDGQFLKNEPTADILSVIEHCLATETLISLWEEKTYRLPKRPQFTIFAGSFGGPAGLLLSKHQQVAKVICVAPVVDWSMESKAEPLPWLFNFVQQAFGNGFRMKKSDWNKLGRGAFYNPIAQPEKIDGKKVLIFHAKDDESIPVETVRGFADKHDIKLYERKVGGHLSLSLLPKAWYWKRVSTFLED